MEYQLIEDRVANLEAQIEELENKLQENTDLLMKFAHLSSGLSAALTVAFENHSHDSGGYVLLPEATKTMYEELIPKMPKEMKNDNGGSDR